MESISLSVLFKSGASGGRDGICQENQWKEPRLWLFISEDPGDHVEHRSLGHKKI